MLIDCDRRGNGSGSNGDLQLGAVRALEGGICRNERASQSLRCWGSTSAHLGMFEQGLDVPLFLGPFSYSDFTAPITTQNKPSPRLTTAPQ